LIYKIYLVIFLNIILTQETFIDSTQIKNPSISWKLSLIPGLGQLYNNNYYKTFVINSLISASYLELKNKDSINKRNTMAWWLFGIYILSILDAYVDSHLTSFPIKKEK
tara:strand:+ start:4174 stop:4500 length:327 start_codon:yes stop_codon:yes gene_type:complete